MILKALFDEKVYTPTLTSAVKSLEYLGNQGCAIEYSDNSIIIKFPLTRHFLLPEEMKAIHIITKEWNGIEIPHFEHHEIVIKTDEQRMSQNG